MILLNIGGLLYFCNNISYVKIHEQFVTIYVPNFCIPRKYEDHTGNRIGYTGGPRYMRETGTPKIGSNLLNLHIKRPRITVNERKGSRKKAIFQLHICKIVDQKTAYT